MCQFLVMLPRGFFHLGETIKTLLRSLSYGPEHLSVKHVVSCSEKYFIEVRDLQMQSDENLKAVVGWRNLMIVDSRVINSKRALWTVVYFAYLHGFKSLLVVLAKTKITITHSESVI